MNFLKESTVKNRLALQLEAYINTIHLSLIDSLVAKNSFKLEHTNLDELDLCLLKIPNTLRLGNRLEYFFDFLVNSNKRYKVIEKNIQIINNKITIGELDFILEDTNNKVLIHIETATKFYLFDVELKEWIGPNRNDSLLKKADKLKAKQFPLLHNEKTLEVLKKKGISTDNIEQCIHFKTQLFIPYMYDIDLFEDEILENIKGFYLYKYQFLRFKDEDFKYFVPEKQDWLVDAKHGEVWYDFETVLESIELHFTENKNPLIWIKKSDTEFNKVFVVNW